MNWSGLKIERARAREMVVNFFDSQLQLKNCITDIKILSLTNEKFVIRVVLDSWDSKIKARQAKKLLVTNNSEIYIDNDLTAREQEIAKHLRDIAKHLRTHGQVVKVNPLRIEFGNVQFFWDSKKNMLRSDKKVKEIPASVTKLLKDTLRDVPFAGPKSLRKPKN